MTDVPYGITRPLARQVMKSRLRKWTMIATGAGTSFDGLNVVGGTHQQAEPR